MLDGLQHTNTRGLGLHIVTYTWNGYVLHNALEARPDLGHLWYVCTDLWVIGLIVLVPSSSVRSLAAGPASRRSGRDCWS